MKLYEALVEKQTVTPTFYYDFPVEVSPLARPHRDDPRLTEHWDLVAFGAEVGTAYSELTDPVDQGERLLAQSFAAAGGDRRRWPSATISYGPSVTACRRPVGSGSGSIG